MPSTDLFPGTRAALALHDAHLDAGPDQDVDPTGDLWLAELRRLEDAVGDAFADDTPFNRRVGLLWLRELLSRHPAA